MNIITAEKAREISNSYIPKEITHALNYVMPKIVESASKGNNKIVLYEDNCPEIVNNQITLDSFYKFMRNHGYNIKTEIKEYYGSFYYKTIISW